MRRIVDALAVLTGWVLIVYCFAVGVEIVGRRFLGFSLQGVDEIGGYLMAILVGVGFSAALYNQAHIRIDILLGHLPRAVAAWLGIAALAALVVFSVFLVSRAWIVLAQSYRMSAVAPTPLLTPMVIPQSVWIAALILFALAAIVCFLRALRHGLRGETDKVVTLVGSTAGGPTDREDA